MEGPRIRLWNSLGFGLPVGLRDGVEALVEAGLGPILQSFVVRFKHAHMHDRFVGCV